MAVTSPADRDAKPPERTGIRIRVGVGIGIGIGIGASTETGTSNETGSGTETGDDDIEDRTGSDRSDPERTPGSTDRTRHGPAAVRVGP